VFVAVGWGAEVSAWVCPAFATAVWVINSGESVWMRIGVVIAAPVGVSGALEAGSWHPDSNKAINRTLPMTIADLFVIEASP
jgi:hypothetical protein